MASLPLEITTVKPPSENVFSCKGVKIEKWDAPYFNYATKSDLSTCNAVVFPNFLELQHPETGAVWREYRLRDMERVAKNAPSTSGVFNKVQHHDVYLFFDQGRSRVDVYLNCVSAEEQERCYQYIRRITR